MNLSYSIESGRTKCKWFRMGQHLIYYTLIHSTRFEYLNLDVEGCVTNFVRTFVKFDYILKMLTLKFPHLSSFYS